MVKNNVLKILREGREQCNILVRYLCDIKVNTHVHIHAHTFIVLAVLCGGQFYFMWWIRLASIYSFSSRYFCDDNNSSRDKWKT